MSLTSTRVQAVRERMFDQMRHGCFHNGGIYRQTGSPDDVCKRVDNPANRCELGACPLLKS